MVKKQWLGLKDDEGIESFINPGKKENFISSQEIDMSQGRLESERLGLRIRCTAWVGVTPNRANLKCTYFLF